MYITVIVRMSRQYRVVQNRSFRGKGSNSEAHMTVLPTTRFASERQLQSEPIGLDRGEHSLPAPLSYSPSFRRGNTLKPLPNLDTGELF